jgi:hypothetical protein
MWGCVTEAGVCVRAGIHLKKSSSFFDTLSDLIASYQLSTNGDIPVLLSRNCAAIIAQRKLAMKV